MTALLQIAVRRRIFPLFFSSLLFALFCALALTGTPSFADDPGYSPEDGQACVDCHMDSGVLGILDTKHADFDDPRTPAGQKQCQSCHGPSAKHMQFPMQVENLHFGSGSKATPLSQNKMCLECHSDGKRAGWSASAHGFESVLCSTCHAIHQPESVVLPAASTTITCTDSCHVDLMAGTPHAEFTHPVLVNPTAEDDFTCATCHNPHGQLESSRCSDCHDLKDDAAKHSAKAKRFHETASKRDVECIRCHKGLAHPIKPLETSANPPHTPLLPIAAH